MRTLGEALTPAEMGKGGPVKQVFEARTIVNPPLYVPSPAELESEVVMERKVPDPEPQEAHVGILKLYIESVADAVLVLLDEHAEVVDDDLGSFVRSYVSSLKHDLEAALDDGEYGQLEQIAGDVRELFHRMSVQFAKASVLRH